MTRYIMEGNGRWDEDDEGLILDDTESKSGLTLWLNEHYDGPVSITYEAEVLEPYMASNINLFLMATTLAGDRPWTIPHSGAYREYHEDCRMYIVTFTGEYEARQQRTGKAEQGWSRLRRNPGFHLLSENDDVQSAGGETYRIEIAANEGALTCRINGRLIHQVVDPDPLTSGAIAFRTWHTRLRLRNIHIQPIKDKESTNE